MNVTTNKPMETITQPKLTGYRQLTQAEADLINEAKALSAQCGAFIEKLRAHPNVLLADPVRTFGTVPLDQRWVSIGATQLQQGWMAVIRGIAQPTTF